LRARIGRLPTIRIRLFYEGGLGCRQKVFCEGAPRAGHSLSYDHYHAPFSVGADALGGPFWIFVNKSETTRPPAIFIFPVSSL